MLASFLGTPARAAQPDVKAAARTLLDAGLRHHRGTLSEKARNDPPAGHSSPAFRLAERAYDLLARTESFNEANVDGILVSAMHAIRPHGVPRSSLRPEQRLATNKESD